MIDVLVWSGEGPLREVAVAEIPAALADPAAVVWVDLGPGDPAEAERVMRDVLKLHPLVVEDCLSPMEQPKIDDYGDSLFLVTHGVRTDGGDALFRSLELDAILRTRLLVTFHAVESRSVTDTRTSVRKAGHPLRRGAAAVLHEILDRQIDRYLPVLEEVELRLDRIEDALFERPTQALLEEILDLKRATLGLRRSLVKQRDVLHRLGRREFALVPDADAWMFRDVEDHLIRAADLLESYREILSDTVEIYLSVTSNRLNQIVKLLTIFSSIILPLSLVAGIYGMNFKHMPETEWPLGYPFALGLMALITAVLLFFFWRRGWLSDRPRPRRGGAAAPPPAEAARLTVEARQRLRAKRPAG
ncbi:MAG: magnesium/cobalt transporter CorA [Deltaproteobacteria bacterium]|nr:magnesium/cobalt transporter CorA [Deltaproteobacteria bacterium]